MDGEAGWPAISQISSAGLWHEMRAQAELLAAVAEQLVDALAQAAALAEALTDLRARSSRMERDLEIARAELTRNRAARSRTHPADQAGRQEAVT